jgi:hypothetical protein
MMEIISVAAGEEIEYDDVVIIVDHLAYKATPGRFIPCKKGSFVDCCYMNREDWKSHYFGIK